MHSEDPTTTNLRAARRAYLDEKRTRLRESTVWSYAVITRLFVKFCEDHSVTETGEVSGHVLASWKARRQSEVKPITLKNNIKHLRNFFRFCEDAEMMDYRTHTKLKVPDVAAEKARSHESMSLGQAEDTLRYLKTYQYATRQHALFQTIWHTGCRISGAIALDVDDLERQNGDFVLSSVIGSPRERPSRTGRPAGGTSPSTGRSGRSFRTTSRVGGKASPTSGAARRCSRRRSNGFPGNGPTRTSWPTRGPVSR